LPIIKLHGHSIEVPVVVLHDLVIGMTYSTCTNAGIIGSVKYLGSDQSLTDGHQDHLEELKQAIIDDILRDQVKILIGLFAQAQKFNDELLEFFVKRTQSPYPKTERDLNKIYKKLEKVIDPNWYPLILAEEGPSKIIEKHREIINDLLKTRGIIIKRIIDLYPELLESEHLSDDDKILLGN
jgi:hypothetical protein